ncbi:indolepyruvate ferredoxin oxidoreductase family protein [Rhizobium sp. TRM95111]|uniref:indolepyruvate ferredoxin oxidoreductase family protein n=1 Tax=Rhizobium alarense TaxID=2846851 RepID=UPI001F1F7648|nr:indolepyruvate ferredoxin oxidoreductase family protein [Rhizobium alarense]MCF3640377.1 indolepyruvate ferredoxin oxidoreductase family protein [Rhizobium alarense]
MLKQTFSLEEKYTAEEGRVFLSGIQALVRLPIVQMRRDHAAGLNTAAFVSGYRGSPLGGYDQQLAKAGRHLAAHGIEFRPGVNEDLAATAIWGTQQLHLSPGARKDGVVGYWYGKGPGVDRSGDVFKHANAAGTAKHGGVLCFAGDDHSCKSSSIPHQSDHAFMSAIIPVLYPSSIQELVEYGLLGIAMSRYSGCWVAMKVISDTIETTATVGLAGEKRQFHIPTDFELPPGGLNLRWPDPPLVQDERLQTYKGYAAIAFARANRVNEVTHDSPKARFGIIASGKAYEDVLEALRELQIGPAEMAEIGMRVYKVRMPWPLEPEGVRQFASGLEEVLVVEERREVIEHQIKQQLFNWHPGERPRIVGKFDHQDHHFLPLSEGLTVGMVARAIAARLLQFEFDAGLKRLIADELDYLLGREKLRKGHVAPVARVPYYCSGCPHNTSTKVPEGSRALAGIGCHFMVQWMDRNTETFTHMGAEGVTWTGIAPFTDEKHVFVNLGDGTYFHSGILAVRQAVAAKVNITYKLLYNDAVAMTGGQAVDGPLSPELVVRQLHDEGVAPIYLLSDTPDVYPPASLAPGTKVLHRDELDTVMRELRETPGCSAIVYVQTCAAEKRRRRSRGLLEDPPKRVMINPAVCEGCGDCSVQSNCVSVEPLDTEMGRKRKINQSTCNKDFSCLKGFCPSFVTVEGGRLRKRSAGRPDISGVPEPKVVAIGDRSYNIAIAGIGGTGILTVSAILGMAAHLDGKAPMILDMAGLAQKGGAVMSHLRIGLHEQDVSSPRIVTGGADLLIAADDVVGASKDAVTLCDSRRATGVVNTRLTPVADFVRNRDFDFRRGDVEATVRKVLREPSHFRDFTAIAETVCGNAIATNLMMAGYAWQKGLIPLTRQSIEQAIGLNGVAVEASQAAFDWGRLLAHAPETVEALMGNREQAPTLETMATDDLIAHRMRHLTAYQDAALAGRYKALVDRVAEASRRVGAGDRLVRTVAHVHARLLAYKDEYEVARLYVDPAFRAGLEAQFQGDYRISFNLAPPFLKRGVDASGRPKKRQFGRWMLTVFRMLAAMKALRGTVFDVFGRTAERRMERQLIADYEALVERVLAGLRPENVEAADALLSSYGDIRGFGPVKEAAAVKVKAREPELLAAFETAGTVKETAVA